MIQLDGEHDQGEETLLRDALYIIADASDLESCVLALLDLAQKMTDAAGVFFVFPSSDVSLGIGVGKDWVGRENGVLWSITTKLAAGIHVNPALPDGLEMPFSQLVSMPIYVEEEMLGGLWLLFDSKYTFSPEKQPALLALGKGLGIATQNFRSRGSKRLRDGLFGPILDSITDPLLVVDRQKQLLFMNRAGRVVFDVDVEAQLGRPVDELLQFAGLPDLFTDEYAAMVDEWLTDDGRSYLPRAHQITDLTGLSHGWILVLRDETRLKKFHRSQSEFVNIVSHDLRSPLTSVKGFASMIESQMAGDLNERQQGFVEKIMSGIAQITALVDNIQDAGKYDPETGFYEMARSDCDLGVVIIRIVENHLVPAEKQELTISVNVGDDVPIINADGTMIERAIINLMDNAIKYTPNGGQVEVGVRREDDLILIHVSDNGLGISEGNQKKLFDRHVRISRKEHKKIKGSGLGLFIVKSVARRHGGDAWVESTEGKGSTFYIGIPLEGDNLPDED